MGMILRRVYSFDCDITDCNNASEDYTPPGVIRRYSQWARRAAIADGWVFVAGGQILCPAHAHLAEGQRTLR